jgi:hypothetical protein
VIFKFLCASAVKAELIAINEVQFLFKIIGGITVQAPKMNVSIHCIASDVKIVQRRYECTDFHSVNFCALGVDITKAEKRQT